MKRVSKVWAISFVLIFLFVSIVSLLLPCKPEYFGGGFFGSACSGELIFTIVNLPGAFLIYLFYRGSQPIYNNIILISISLILNSILYVFIGTLIGKIAHIRK